MLRNRVLPVLLAALGLAVGFSAPVSQASVIISEVMYNPAGEDYSTTPGIQFNRQWIELYNSGATTIDVSGWRLGETFSGVFASAFPSGTTIAAGKALVVTGDAATFDSQWGTGISRIQVSSFPTLPSTPSRGGQINATLRNATGVVQDAINVNGAQGGWFKADGSQGQSIFALPNGLNGTGNDAGANWRPSAWGAYGARYRGANGGNSGSPGTVVTQLQDPFAPSPDAAWSMVVIPDTQNYVKNTADYHVLNGMIDWIVDNREEYGIQLVLQEGDIVNQNDRVTPTSGNQSSAEQWVNARNAFSKLNGVLPYVMAAGNHDLGTSSAQTRQTFFNNYFKASDNPLVDPAQGGILSGYQVPGELQNAYFEFTAPDGRELLVFSLEFWPNQATVDWANEIAARPEFADRTAVLLTHSYMNSNEQRTNASPSSYEIGNGPHGDETHDGEQLWQELVRNHGNFEMTFSGHVGGDGIGYLRSVGVEGNPVHQMLINTQFEANGGNGWFRVLEFLNDGVSVRVRTYSPYLDMYRTDAANDYVITLSALPAPPLTADFSLDGIVDQNDLLIWKRNFSRSTGVLPQHGDANGDGIVDGADFMLWQRQLGRTSQATPVSSAVPEPAALTQTLLLSLAAWSVRKRNDR
jgi:hypothetical protein